MNELPKGIRLSLSLKHYVELKAELPPDVYLADVLLERNGLVVVHSRCEPEAWVITCVRLSSLQPARPNIEVQPFSIDPQVCAAVAMFHKAGDGTAGSHTHDLKVDGPGAMNHAAHLFRSIADDVQRHEPHLFGHADFGAPRNLTPAEVFPEVAQMLESVGECPHGFFVKSDCPHCGNVAIVKGNV